MIVPKLSSGPVARALDSPSPTFWAQLCLENQEDARKLFAGGWDKRVSLIFPFLSLPQCSWWPGCPFPSTAGRAGLGRGRRCGAPGHMPSVSLLAGISQLLATCRRAVSSLLWDVQALGADTICFPFMMCCALVERWAGSSSFCASVSCL